ncbi:helix-turn-helix transcriptional regulator [Streptococcus suis]|uniref:helix-turn-helix domain-containing protein n=1 Tax=Streptococcus suis TaxID=1307 RepID=UPI0030E79678
MEMIRVNLDKILKDRQMTSKDLAEQIGITEANLSILKTGKAKGIRFNTLMSICRILDCQPGDILEYVKEGELHRKNSL